mgnify:CR=1 FL=1
MKKYRAIIVEDERLPRLSLIRKLEDYHPDINIVECCEDYSSALKAILRHRPDILFLDIQLQGSTTLQLLSELKGAMPLPHIIFTTAYNNSEYLLQAIRLAAADYLLKPVKVGDIRHALDKYSKLTRQDLVQYLSQLTQLAAPPKYQDRLLIPIKDKLIPVNLRDVSCFYTTDKNTFVYLKNGEKYPYSKTLEQIIATLDPAHFIRANKQFIVAKDSVTNITIWFDNRLLVTLDTEVPERMYISKNKASEFKSWIVK